VRLLLAGAAALACLAGCTSEPTPTATPSPSPSGTVTRAPLAANPTTTTPPPPAPPPCAPNVRACVRLSTNQAWLTGRGRAAYGPIPIAHGGQANPTPTGTYPVAWKDKENTSSVYGTPMPYSVFFAPGGIAFHQGDIDTDSHGCVRLRMADARRFFAQLRPGEIVQVLP
jgi:hypothetical protein